PVVAANSGGAPEVVKDGVNGFLVEYNNVKQLSQKLVELCLNADLRARYGKAGKEILLERFTFPQFKNSLKDILKRNSPGRISNVRSKRALTKAEGAVKE
ncbi:MAG: glycosyltransferase, partial [Pyrinomonadaceae bacterium]